MKTLSLTLLSLVTLSFAAPHPNKLEARQKDVTYTVTCLGPRCTDYPPTTLRIPTTVPGGGPQPPKTTQAPNPPTTKKTSTTSRYTPPPETPNPPTSRKTSTTSKYTPPPESPKPPTKTVKPPQEPTKTGGGEVGPSSTRCPVPLYYQCGGYYDGKPWSGCTKCVSGASCLWQNEWYYQCVADE